MVEYVEYVNLQYYFSHLISLIHFFATPSIKVKLGQQISGEPTNSKPPGPIVTIGQSERNTEQQSGPIYYTLLCGFTLLLLRLSPATRKLWNYAEPKTMFLIQPSMFLTFLYPISLCRITDSAPLEMLLVYPLCIFFCKMKFFLVKRACVPCVGQHEYHTFLKPVSK